MEAYFSIGLFMNGKPLDKCGYIVPWGYSNVDIEYLDCCYIYKCYDKSPNVAQQVAVCT